MTIERNGEFAEAPRYQQIAGELRENIADSVYKGGERLPTEESLALRFNVNRHTLRRAISLLAAEGLVRVEQGRGTFVVNTATRASRKEQGIKRLILSGDLQLSNVRSTSRLVRILEMPASPTIAYALTIERGDPVIVIEKVGIHNNLPIVVVNNYFPGKRFPGLSEYLVTGNSPADLLRDKYGCEWETRYNRVAAQLITPEDARLLEVAYNTPILCMETIIHDAEARPFRYKVQRFRADMVEIQLPTLYSQDNAS